MRAIMRFQKGWLTMAFDRETTTDCQPAVAFKEQALVFILRSGHNNPHNGLGGHYRSG